MRTKGQSHKDMNQSKMVHPQKWRETCDPYSLVYHNFQLREIIGYPHAGNDVFHARGIYNGEEITAYIKAARQKGAAIENEIEILSQLDDQIFPKVIDSDFEQLAFSVTMEMPGLRLSTIVGENQDMLSLSYMEEYGEALSKLHRMKLSASQQTDRKFFHCPTQDMLGKLDIACLTDFFKKQPAPGETVFCHGDFHYANILWENHHISAILDFELSGYGNRDFDIAWALFLRPGQKFLKTDEEQRRFLKGYSRYGTYDADAVRYYMAQNYVHFLNFSSNDEYCGYVRAWLISNCTKGLLTI